MEGHDYYENPEEDFMEKMHDDEESEEDVLSAYQQAAIAGSRRELQEIKKLPAAEAKIRLTALLKRIDQNNNLVLEREELRHWILTSFKHLDAELEKESFKLADANLDGSVSWPEILQSRYQLTPEAFQSLAANRSAASEDEHAAVLQAVTTDQKRFNLADLDKNAQLNRREFGMYKLPQHHAEMADFVVERALQDYDTNKDGLIDEKETRGGAKLTVHDLLVVQKNFKDADSNQDGFVDRKELAVFLMPGVEKQADAEVDHLFKDTDSDLNGQLSYGEVLAQIDLWIGSHATNFGHHLTPDLSPKTEL